MEVPETFHTYSFGWYRFEVSSRAPYEVYHGLRQLCRKVNALQFVCLKFLNKELIWYLPLMQNYFKRPNHPRTRPMLRVANDVLEQIRGDDGLVKRTENLIEEIVRENPLLRRYTIEYMNILVRPLYDLNAKLRDLYSHIEYMIRPVEIAIDLT